jgi:uncharacterized protein
VQDRDDGRAASRLTALREHVRALGSVLVCYSGGIDSALVLAVAHAELGPRAIGMTAISPSVLPLELEEAAAIARELGADHRVVSSNEIEDPDYRKNHVDRCFFCKSELYLIAEDRRAAWGLDHVLNGTNTDDLGDHRPGLVAASNAGVKSPLVELGFTKTDVRVAARALGLTMWDKPAAACLSSRIPFGTEVTRERLEKIGALETALRALGFRRVRVRFHPIPASPGTLEGAIARIELDPSDIARAVGDEARDGITAAGRAAGFTFVTIDLAGYRMGSHNAVVAVGPPGTAAVAPRSLPILR